MTPIQVMLCVTNTLYDGLRPAAVFRVMPVAASEVANFGLGAGCGYEDSRTLIGCPGQDGRRVRIA